MAGKTWRRVLVLGGLAAILLCSAAWLFFWFMRPRPTVCHFEGVDALQVGQAMAQVDSTEYESHLFGGSYKSTWSDSFKEQIRQARGGTSEWALEEFLSSTEGQDRVGFENLSGGCRVELTCLKKSKSIVPLWSHERYIDRERRILLRAYRALKEKNVAVTAECADGWRPSDPALVESHDGAIWLASRNLPLDAAAQHFIDRGFAVDSRTAERIELSGHFANDPFGVIFGGGLFNSPSGVSLDERVVIKTSNGATALGLWAAGSGHVTTLLGSETKKVTSDDNLPALTEMWNSLALRYSLQPLPPKLYVEKIKPPSTATAPADQQSDPQK